MANIMKTFLIALAWIGVSTAMAAVDAARPNIIFILADDLGAEALGCYGGHKFVDARNQALGEVKTPHLDAMAAGGMRFESAFATPVCSPSRAEFLTGKYNHRIGFPDILGRGGSTRELDAAAHPTIAQLLKRAGYVTAAVGKWHLGPQPGPDKVPPSIESDTTYAHPRACGFDRQFLVQGAHLREYGEPVAGRYTPDQLHAWAKNFIVAQKDRAEPFFLYYASPLPHFPYWPTPLNPDGPRGDATTKTGEMYGDMRNFPYLVEYLDMQVGDLLQELESLGLRENTLVIFAGDNGTPSWVFTEMKDGRNVKWGKASMLDTGSRVPVLASWPGKVAPGSVYRGLVDFTDLLPTLLDLAGAPSPENIDGISFASGLLGAEGVARNWVHVLYGDQYFVRDDRYKLRENGELYDVSGAPHVETLVEPGSESPGAAASRQTLNRVLDNLHPSRRQVGEKHDLH